MQQSRYRLAFSGCKQSEFGRDGGAEGTDEYPHSKYAPTHHPFAWRAQVAHFEVGGNECRPSTVIDPRRRKTKNGGLAPMAARRDRSDLTLDCLI